MIVMKKLMKMLKMKRKMTMKIMRHIKKNLFQNMMTILRNLKNIKFCKGHYIILKKVCKKLKILLDFVKGDIFLKIMIYMKID